MGIGTAVSSRTGLFFGWWIVFASAAIVFLTGGPFFYGFGTLFDPLVKEFGWSRASISLAFSLRSEVGGLAAPVVGFLVDRVGSRRLMVGGVALVALGFLLLSRVQALWTFYGAVFVIALGMSAAGGTVGYVAIAHWFRRRRGQAMGLMTMGGGASGVMVMVMAVLISAYDWRTALLVMGVTQLAVCIPLAWSIRDRPEDIGLAPDGVVEPRQEMRAVEESDPTPEEEGLTARQALRSGAFWRLSISVALANLGMTSIVVHQIPFFTSSVGLSREVAAASVTALTLLTLIGRFGGGYLADIIDKRKVLAAAYAVAGVAILLFATIYAGWQIFLVVPLFALGYGGVIPVRAAFQAEYFGLRAYGAIQGMVFTIATLGGVAGPVLVGWIYDQTESYRLAFVLVSAGTLLAAPLMLTMPRPAGTTRSLAREPR